MMIGTCLLAVLLVDYIMLVTLHAGSDSCLLVSSSQEGGQEPGGQAVPRTRHCATPSHDFRNDFLKKNVRKRRYNISSCIKGTQA
jgi:hypothetical protein